MKALLIIAPKDFRDEELFDTKTALEEEGIDVIVASRTRGEATGMLGRTVKPDLTLDDVVVDSAMFLRKRLITPGVSEGVDEPCKVMETKES